MLTFYYSQVQDGNSIGLIVYYVRLVNYYPKKKSTIKQVSVKSNEKK